MDNLATKIKQLRQQQGFTQQYLAQKIGVSRPTFIQIESGAREPTVSEIQKIAEVLEISLDYFFSIAKPPLDKLQVKLEAPRRVKKPTEERISVPRTQVDKFKEVLLYLLEKVGAKASVGQTVIYKLLYFIDFDYYEKFEDQLIGARYIKNHHGPTPKAFSKIIEEMVQGNEIEVVKSKYFNYEQTKYLPRRSSNLSLLSAQEVKHIDEVLARLGDKNATELSDYSHQDVPWITANEGETLDYESVFYRTTKTSVRNYDFKD